MRLTSYQNSKLIWFKILNVFLRIVGDITMFHFMIFLKHHLSVSKVY